MATVRTFRKSGTRTRRRKRRFSLTAFLPGAPLRRRWARAFRRAPPFAQVLIAVTVVLVAWVSLNWTYQVIRKPTELFFPVSGTLNKTPTETWQEYGPIFRAHSTPTITPEFLAALAQVEGSGNPVARTYWRWSLTTHPFEVYRPASSAVGMYQFTDGTFDEAREFCIHDHRRGSGRTVARMAVVLVQRALYARGADQRGGDGRGVSRRERGTRVGSAPDCVRDARTATERGRADAPVRRRRGRRIRGAPIPVHVGATVR